MALRVQRSVWLRRVLRVLPWSRPGAHPRTNARAQVCLQYRDGAVPDLQDGHHRRRVRGNVQGEADARADPPPATAATAHAAPDPGGHVQMRHYDG